MADHLAKAVRELTELPARPAGVFVCGDCAWDSGEKNDYTTLSKLLAPLREAQMPVCLTLGNHDQRDHFREVLKDDSSIKPAMTERNAVLWRSRRVNWFVLDSLEKTLSVPGLLGEEQLAWLGKTLDENPDKPAIILVHHNPDRKDNVDGLKDTSAFYAVIRPRKQVKAYIFGHTHNWSVGQDESGIHLINLPPVAYVFRAGNPNGWTRATIADSGMQLELRCVDTTHKLHGQKVDLKWRATS
jgi:3',5'-cyclic AMP phosphodiesterase CpdA